MIYNEEDADNLLRLRARFEPSSSAFVTFFADLFNGAKSEQFGLFDYSEQLGVTFSYGL